MSDPRRLDDLESLVRRAQGGDEAARDELIRQCYDRIYRWALAQTGDRDDADDVTQTVLVRLHTHLDRFSGRSRFTTWLFRVTQNAAHAMHRRSRARQRLAASLAREVRPEPPAADPTGHLHAASLGETLRSFFTELSATQRQVVDLADLQGVPQTEIAEMLDMNPATVRAHLFRARRALRAKMLARFPSLAEGRP